MGLCLFINTISQEQNGTKFGGGSGGSKSEKEFQCRMRVDGIDGIVEEKKYGEKKSSNAFQWKSHSVVAWKTAHSTFPNNMTHRRTALKGEKSIRILHASHTYCAFQEAAIINVT